MFHRGFFHEKKQKRHPNPGSQAPLLQRKRRFSFFSPLKGGVFAGDFFFRVKN